MKTKAKIATAIGIPVLAVALVLAGVVFMPSAPLKLDITAVQVDVSAGIYYEGSTIEVYVNCTPAQPIKAWELVVNYDPNIIHASTVTMGNIFGGFQQFFSAGEINNTSGKITKVYNVIVGQGNVTHSGSFVKIAFEAVSSGSSTITLTGTGVTNETMYVPITVSNSEVHIASQYDMNGDGVVNMLDLLDVAAHYGETGPQGWIKQDVDQNGQVKVLDLVLVATYFEAS